MVPDDAPDDGVHSPLQDPPHVRFATACALYLPAPQSIQELATVAPVVARYLPAAQLLQAVAPVEAEYVPLMQSVHGAVPVTALYFPTEQPTHGPPFGPVKPLLHSHSVTAVPPGGALEWAGHLAHSAAPVAGEYVPAGQSVQAVEAARVHFPVKPLDVTEPSDVKVTLRRPPVDV